MARQIQFPSILRQLIDERGLKGNQVGLAQGVHVSPSLLSQYMAGKTRPSLGVLVDLAEFFDVSLDYLVFGLPGDTRDIVDYGPVARHFESELQRLYDHMREAESARERLNRRLLWGIDEALEASLGSGIRSKGVLNEEEIARLEAYSARVDLLVPNLHEDIIELPSGDYAGGLFVPVVASNLARGRQYRFLLPEGWQEWRSVVQRLRSLLGASVSYELVSRLCEFRITSEAIYAGLGIYSIDVNQLRADDPLLHDAVAPYVGEAGQFVFLQPPSREFRAAAVLDGYYAVSARTAYKNMWDSGTQV